MKTTIKHFCKSPFLLLAALAMAFVAPAANAIVCQFNQTSGAWNVAANWSGDCAGSVVPGPSDRAEITAATVSFPAGTFNVGDLYLGNAVLQGAGIGVTTLNVVGAGTIAWGSGFYDFRTLSVNINTLSPLPAANGPLLITDAVITTSASSTVNFAQVTIAGGIQSAIVNAGTFLMQGDINSGVGTGGIQNLPTGFFQVNGTLQLTGPFKNDGVLKVDSPNVITLNSAASYQHSASSSEIEGSGTVAAPGQTLTLGGGKAKGNLTFIATTVNNTGTVMVPGGLGAVGVMNITGDYAGNALADMEIEITVNSTVNVSDRLAVSGAASIGGGNIAFFYIDTGFGAYNTTEFDTFDVLTHNGTFSGGFSGFSAPATQNSTSLFNAPTSVQFVVGPVIAVVTNTNDAGAGSLREVLTTVNTCDNAGTEILFNLGVTGGTISPLSPLPPITCPMRIRGYSQTGSSPNSSSTDWNGVLNVTLDGSACSGCSGFAVDAAGVVIDGINFTNWNKGVQILANGSNASIHGNYFFQGNIGVSHEGGDFVTIGETPFIDTRNVFVHATQAGILSTGYAGSFGLTIANNLIGAGAGLATGPNLKGISIISSNGAKIENNVIAFNGKGIAITSGTGNSYRQGNRIFGNTTIGVDLGDDGPTANDDATPPYDTDTGANLLVNFPTITSLTNSAPDTVVNYVLKTTAGTATNVCFCGSASATENQCSSGPICTSIGTDASGLFTGSINLPQTGDFALPVRITAFQQPEGGPKAGNASEISPGVNLVAASPAISVTGTTTFPATAVGGASAVQTITITNTGAANLVISSISHTNPDIFGDTVNGPPPQAAHWCGFGSDTMGFPIPGMPISIAPMATCQLVLNFKPNTSGLINGTITINSNAPTSPTAIVLTGTGVALPPVALALGAASIPTGSSTTLTITLSNAGGSPNPISSGSMTLPGGLTTSAVVMPSTTCGSSVSTVSTTISFSGGSIPAGGSCTITVTIDGLMASMYTLTFPIGGLITGSGNNAFAATANLAVTVSAVPSMTVSFSPTSVLAGAPSTLTLTLGNPDSSPAFISGGSVTLPAGLTGTAPMTNSCGTFGSFGGQTYSFGMGSIPSMGTCTIDIPVSAATGGTYTVNIAAGALSAGVGSNANTSTASLLVTLPATVITSANTASGTVGTPFSYTITATNPPSTFSATGLPPGVTVNTATGLLSGTPTVAGTYNVNAGVSNAGGTASLIVTITITAVPVPAVTLAPATVPFGSRTVNTTSAASVVTLTNSGTASLLLSGITAGGDFAYTTTCPLLTPPIAPAGNCTFNITFTPLTAAALTGSISIASNAPGSPHVISLTGTGVPVAVPNLTLNTTSLDLGSQSLGSSSIESGVLVSNTGFATLNLTSITVTGSGFARVLPSSSPPADCGTSVAPGANCQVAVKFTPAVLGPATGQISIVNNATGSPHLVSLAGTGIAFAQPSISLPANIAFGDQVLNTTSNASTLSIGNPGTAALSVTSVAISGTNAADFRVIGDCSSVPSSGTCALTVTFTPGAIGARTAQVEITSNGSGGTSVTDSVLLSGTGVLAPRPIAELTVTAIGYGNNIFGGATPSQTVGLRNTGGVALSIQGIFATGDFVQASSCPASLAPGASCIVSVMFSPLGLGSRTGELQILTNASGSPHRVLLSGTGCRWFSQSQSRFFLTACGN